MSMSDPIADMLTRIRNAQMAKHPEVLIAPVSNQQLAIAEVLKDEGYVRDYTLSDGVKRTLTIELKYYRNQGKVFPVIAGLKRISRPGLRVYKGAKEMPYVCGGYGVAVVSTTAGVKSGKEARRLNHGGEIICYVW